MPTMQNQEDSSSEELLSSSDSESEEAIPAVTHVPASQGQADETITEKSDLPPKLKRSEQRQRDVDKLVSNIIALLVIKRNEKIQIAKSQNEEKLREMTKKEKREQ